MKELLAKYANGNYYVKLYTDGTKIRYNKLDHFTPEFPESIDLTITTRCNGGCEYCYLNCTEQGVHANLSDPILDTLRPGTELAINANDFSHPELESFLKRMKEQGVIVNITVNQNHFLSNLSLIKEWQDNKLIWGIGVSLTDSSVPELIQSIQHVKNVVIHVIDGCLTEQDLKNLSNHDIKLLILGFKNKGRGIPYYIRHKEEVDHNIQYLKEHLYDYRKYFNGFGFDNLATQHLDIRSVVGEEQWQLYHMGEEGEFTFFMDLVNKKFAMSSLDTTMYDFLGSVDDMFRFVRLRRKGW